MKCPRTVSMLFVKNQNNLLLQEQILKHGVMKKFILLLAAIIFSVNVFCQSPDWLWAKAMGGANYEEGLSIAVDASGNIYTTGAFQGTVDFDPGAGVFNLTSAGGYDIFIS